MAPKCVSKCATCGTLCEAFPITDLGSLKLYSSKGCTVIVGDLYIQDLAAAVTKKLLFDHLKNVQRINGYLHFKDNRYISAMTFFSNLVGLHGAFYSNNPQLVDARMPSLQELRYTVEVQGCNRLCPARYTAVGAGPNDSHCPNPLMKYYFQIKGDASVADVGFLGAIVGRVVQNLTNSEVGRSCA